MSSGNYEKDERITFNRFRKDRILSSAFALGGEKLAGASYVIRTDDGAVSDAPYNSEEEIDRGLEQAALIEVWARENGCWIESPDVYYLNCGYAYYGFGGEARVFVEGSQYVHKIVRIEQYDSPQRFSDRIVIENAICPQACLEVEGFSNDSANGFMVLLKQKFFKSIRGMEDEEIDAYMISLGFEKIGNYKFVSKYYIADDLHPANVLISPDGNVNIIDGAFYFNTPDLGLGGEYTFL